MNRDEILSIWFQPDKLLRRVAVQTVVTHLPASWDVCLDMLADCPEQQLAELVGPLRAAMPFLKTGFGPADSCVDGRDMPATTQHREDGHYTQFDKLHQAYRALLATLTARNDRALLRTCYRLMDGLRPDLRQQFPDTDFTDCLRADEACADRHQLMVFVTGVCNLHCSYCFSNNLERHYITAEDLRRIFAWARRNGCTMITPCGGEPLVYPYIGLFLDLVAENGLTTYFATNATIPLDRFQKRQLAVIDLLTMHMTRSLWENPEHMSTFCRNIELAQQEGIDIIARCNITRPDLDVDRWFELADRHHLKRMNIALTIPSSLHNNRYVDTRLFTDYVPLIRHCIDMCQERGIDLSFAKPLPPCIFDEPTAAWLLQYDNFAPICNVHDDHGTRNVCLSPELQFTPCLGVHTPSIGFSDELTWDDLVSTMGREVERVLQEPLFETCHRCFLFDRKLCQGACLSYKYLTKA